MGNPTFPRRGPLGTARLPLGWSTCTCASRVYPARVLSGAVERPCALTPLPWWAFLAHQGHLKRLHWHVFCEGRFGNRSVLPDSLAIGGCVDAVTANWHDSANRGRRQTA